MMTPEEYEELQAKLRTFFGAVDKPDVSANYRLTGPVVFDDDATRTLERVKALLEYGLSIDYDTSIDSDAVSKWNALFDAWREIEALEARREAGRDA